jgi:hypothetical protein
MKRVIKASLIALLVAVTAPAISNAQTTVMGGPYTNLKATGQVIHLALSNYPSTAGLYVMQCVKSETSARPSLCNQAAQLWISTSAGASFAPTADIQFKPTAAFTSGSTNVDCTKSICGIFIRLDHTAPTDLSEDQFIPLTFVADATPALAADVVTATVNGTALSAAAPLDVKYRDVFKVEAVSKAGAALSYASLAPACAINGNEVTVLKGTGYCDIAVTSAGNATASTVTAHFPLKLNPGVQSVAFTTSGKAGSKIALPATSNFGEKVKYSVTKNKNCSLMGNTLTLNKKGACVVKVSAPAMADTYLALAKNTTVKIK